VIGFQERTEAELMEMEDGLNSTEGNVCFNLFHDMILFGGSSRYPVRDGVYMLREIFAGALPAHPARM